MDSHPHDTAYRWITAVIASGLVLAIAVGGMFTMRERLVATAEAESQKHAEEREKLADRLDRLERSLAARTTQTEVTVDTHALEEKLDTLGERLAGIEQKSEEKKAEHTLSTLASDATIRLKLAALSGKSFTHELDTWAVQHSELSATKEVLAPFASLGIPSEATLVRGLLHTLGTRPVPAAVEDESWVGKVNAHLKGFISIRRVNDTGDAYTTLRHEATTEELSTLIRHVERLDDTARAPLEEWLNQANARQKALDALDSLGRGMGQ